MKQLVVRRLNVECRASLAAKRNQNGRPSAYSEGIATALCDRLASGESLRAICASGDMPSRSMVHRWLNAEAHFRDQYARAREAQAHTLADEILEIADDATNDWMIREGHGGEGSSYAFNGENVQRSRLRIDSRKWFASKVAPKKYGDKLELAGDKNNPLFDAGEIAKVLDAKLNRMIDQNSGDDQASFSGKSSEK